MKRHKKFAVAGITGAMLVGAGAGVVLNLPAGAGASGVPSVATAATDNTSTTDTSGTTDSTDTTVAAPDPSTDTPTPPADGPGKAGRGEFLKTQLDALVADGTITQAQADAILAGIEAARPTAGDGSSTDGTGGPGKGGHPGGGGHGGPGMGGGRGAGLGGPLGVGIDAAATALGVTTDELKTELEAGKTIADVATEKGVDVQTVIDAIVASETAELTERVTDAVNGVKPTPPAAPDDTATTTPSSTDTTPTTTG